MTSPMTHADTLADFALHNYYGLEADQVHFFQQGVLPCLSVVDGEEDDDDAAAAGVKFIMKSPSELATAPDGNGGIYKALHASSSVDGDASMISDMERRGVQHLFANAVDNCACKVADPVFLGFCAQGNFLAANKVTEKRSPTEKVGLQCRRGVSLLAGCCLCVCEEAMGMSLAVGCRRNACPLVVVIPRTRVLIVCTARDQVVASRSLSTATLILQFVTQSMVQRESYS